MLFERTQQRQSLSAGGAAGPGPALDLSQSFCGGASPPGWRGRACGLGTLRAEDTVGLRPRGLCASQGPEERAQREAGTESLESRHTSDPTRLSLCN